MECSLSGNALKTFARSITCLARIGSELIIKVSPSLLSLYTLNSSRSAYLTMIYKAEFFDTYTLSAAQAQCSVLLKTVCTVLRTPPSSTDRLHMLLPDSDAEKVQFIIDCMNGLRKTYWITCNIQPEIQHLSLDKSKFPSYFVIKPRDFSRLLANFQASLQEITVIATESTPLTTNADSTMGGKAVELRSFIDPAKDSRDAALHTQLWINPAEEFLLYTHTGDPVDVTFSMKELKAFLALCEGCEVDIHFLFEKAGEPILMAPKFGLDDGSSSDFDATLVLATMLVSQLREANGSDPMLASSMRPSRPDHESDSQAHNRLHPSRQEWPRAPTPSPVSENPSDHTRVWSELSGSAAIPTSRNDQQAPLEGNANAREKNASGIQVPEKARAASKGSPMRENVHSVTMNQFATNHLLGVQDIMQPNIHESRHHPSNWVSDADDDEDDGEEEIFVQSTP
ncbi:hypothetical protein AMTRI_Chr02g223050 [Amborella trichopoda]